MTEHKLPSDKSNSLHHIFPEMFLCHFTKNSKIDVVNRIDGTVRCNQTIERIARIRGFYTYIDKDGNECGDLEDAIANIIESPVSNFFNNVDSIFPYVPNFSEIPLIAQFVAFQSLRTPEFRRKNELIFDMHSKMEFMNTFQNRDNIIEAMKEKGVELTEDNIRKAESYMENLHNFEIVPHKNQSLEIMMSILPERTAWLTSAYSWHIIAFDRPCLVVGDSPLALVQDEKVPEFYRSGFPTAKEIYFPLTSKRYLLLSSDRYAKSTIIKGTKEMAMRYNLGQLHQSHLEVYCHPDATSSIAGITLGERPLIRISGGFASFLDEYNKPPIRQRPYRK